MLNQADKTILNSLKCPLCKCPVDINPVKNYNYGCALNPTHYRVMFDYSLSKIKYQTLSFCVEDNKYIITINDFGKPIGFKTEIIFRKLDGNGLELFSHKEKKIILEGNLFDFTNFTEEKYLNRIHTILAFN